MTRPDGEVVLEPFIHFCGRLVGERAITVLHDFHFHFMFSARVEFAARMLCTGSVLLKRCSDPLTTGSEVVLTSPRFSFFVCLSQHTLLVIVG